MPTLGSGTLTGSHAPYRAMAAMYFATYNSTSIAAAPTAKLGSSEPATATWTKIGLLQGDDFTVTTAEPSFIEDRRGFKRVLYARAINQAGSAQFEGLVVESDPEAINRISGDTLNNIGASAGKRITVTLDQLYDKTVLLYCYNAFDTTKERYIHIPHGQVRFQLDRGESDIWVLRTTIEALQYAGATNYVYEEGRFD